MPATRSSSLPATLLAALTLFSVNCGNATRMAMKSTARTARISRATLRYVTVVHATWMPGLRLAEDTFWTENLVKPLGIRGKDKS